MKAILFIIYSTFLISFSVSETSNFEIDEKKVIWQKVYASELTKEELIKKITSSGNFNDIKKSEESLTATINELSLDYEGYGSSEMSTPMYIARSYVKAFVLIEFKEKRYRVTIKNIKFVQKYDDGLSEVGETSDLELYALRKRNTEFKKSFLKKPSKIMNYTFESITKFKKKAKKDKW